MGKFLTFKLTLDEVNLIMKGLLKDTGNVPLVLMLGAQIEAQQPNPHPDAVALTNERFQEDT